MSKGRPYGIRKQDWEAIKQFEYEKQQRPAIVGKEPIPLDVPCRCSFRPYPHIIRNHADKAAHDFGGW